MNDLNKILCSQPFGIDRISGCTVQPDLTKPLFCFIDVGQIRLVQENYRLFFGSKLSDNRIPA